MRVEHIVQVDGEGLKAERQGDIVIISFSVAGKNGYPVNLQIPLNKAKKIAKELNEAISAG